jgi:glutathionylspermidine amidase/synthetase
MFYARNDSGEAMPRALPFGALLGVAPPGVPAYSSDYESATGQHEREGYRAYHEGTYTGYKYQCVEYARRWLVSALDVTFQDVHMAYHIFQLKKFIRVADNTALPVVKCPNGVSIKENPECRPRLGSVIIWEEGGFFRHTGHVGIVVEATDDYVRVAEQNVTDARWRGNFARELPVTIGADGSYTIRETYRRSAVLGWLHLPAHIESEQKARREAKLAEESASPVA